MRNFIASVLAHSLSFLPAAGQTPELSKTVKPFVRVEAPRVVLTHVRVIDGTGAAAVEDQNVVIEDGKISMIQKGADVAGAAGTTILDLRGYTVIPGIPWILAGLGVGLGLATCFVLNTIRQPYTIGNEDVEDAANKTSRWGTKQRVAGKGGSFVGKLKQGIGKATGDDELAGEGVMDQRAGAGRDTVGKAANAVNDTVHDLNR
jgi:uncharacterized protein YjbJ (UPF0337 family)